MRKLLLIFLGVVIILVLGSIGYFYNPNQEQTQEQKNQVNKVITPSQEMVGDDRDEHGCIGSAGYSWCESKNKCLRTWEEECPSDDTDLIKEALIKKNNWGEDLEFTVNISGNDGIYANGLVVSQGGGGFFFAKKVNGAWEIVADGNGVIFCSSLEKYQDYPKTLIPECYDEQTGETVAR